MEACARAAALARGARRSTLERMIAALPRPVAIALGNLETAALPPRRDRCRAPVFIGGMARSGSTMLLRAIATANGVATHQYRDHPGVFFPLWWNRASAGQVARTPRDARKERAHGDGIRIGLASPEGFEEPLWKAFGLDGTRPGIAEFAPGAGAWSRFLGFYRDYMDKIAGLRCPDGNGRYAVKNNLLALRLRALAEAFPAAVFLVPVRHPAAQIASLVRQHRLYVAADRLERDVGAGLAAMGHHEFGPARRVVDVGGARGRDGVAAALDAQRAGDDRRFYARQWADIYDLVCDLAEDPSLCDRVILLRHEDILARPSLIETAGEVARLSWSPAAASFWRAEIAAFPASSDAAPALPCKSVRKVWDRVRTLRFTG